MNLKDALGDIHPNRANFHDGRSPRWDSAPAAWHNRCRRGPSTQHCERMCGRPLGSKDIFGRIRRRDACSHVFGLFARPLLRPLALMNSADRLPISETRCDAAFALRVLPLPGGASGSSSPPEHGPRLRRTAASGTRDLSASAGLDGAARAIGLAARQHGPDDSGRLGGHRHRRHERRPALDQRRHPGAAFSGWALAWRNTAIAPEPKGRAGLDRRPW